MKQKMKTEEKLEKVWSIRNQENILKDDLLENEQTGEAEEQETIDKIIEKVEEGKKIEKQKENGKINGKSLASALVSLIHLKLQIWMGNFTLRRTMKFGLSKFTGTTINQKINGVFNWTAKKVNTF